MLQSKGAAGVAAPGYLFICRFQVIVQPEACLDFALSGAEGLSFPGPARATQVLGVTPQTDRRGSGGVVLIGLHGALQWLARIGQVGAKRNQQNTLVTR